MKKEDDKITSFFDRENKEQKTKRLKNKKNTASKTVRDRKMATPKKEGKSVVAETKNTKKVGARGNLQTGKKSVTLRRAKQRKNKATTLFRKKRNLEAGQAKKINKASRVNRKKNDLLEKIINALLVVFIFTLPFFVTRQTFQGIDFEKSFYFVVFVAVILLFNLFKMLIRREVKIQRTFLDKCLLLFIFIYSLSTWLSVDRWHSLVGFFGDPSRGLVEILAVVIFFYLVLSNFSLETAKRTYWAIVWVVVLTSFYTLLSGLAIIPQTIQTKIPFSFIGSTVGLTIFLSMGIPLLATAILELNKNRNIKFTKFYQGIIFFSLIAILLDFIILQTFMGWFGLLAGIIIVSFLILNQKPKQKGKFVKTIIFTVFAIFIGIAALANSGQQRMIPSLAKIGLPNEMRVGLPVSYDIIKHSVMAGVKQSVLGSGPATFGYDFAKFHSGGMMSLLPTILYQGDGIIAEGIPTLGLAGGIIILLIVISFVVRAINSLGSRKQSKLYLFGLFSASIVWLMNALMGQIDAGILFFGVIVLTLTTYFIIENFKNKKQYYTISIQKFSPKVFFTALFVLAGIGLTVMSIAYAGRLYSADKFLNQAMGNKDINENIQAIGQAIELNPREGVYYTKLGQAYLIAVNKANIYKAEDDKSGIDQEKIKKYLSNSLISLRQGAKLMPRDARALRSLAMTYKLTGETKLAEEVYQQLIVLEPNGLEHYVSLGDLQLTNLQDNRDEKLNRAIQFYEQALKVNPLASDVYYKLSLIYSQKNDRDKALKNIAQAVRLTPNNELYRFTLGILLQNSGEANDLANAEKIYKSILTVNPNSIDVRTQLGTLYEQTNHLDEAKAEYKKVIEIIGDKEGYQNIKKAMEKFLDNLNKGKLNVGLESSNNQKDAESKNEESVAENSSSITDNSEKQPNTTEMDTASEGSEMVTITVDSEGPINVRSEGSLSGKKLTKIKNTGQFKKLQQKGQWIQVVIPADDEHQEEVVGWVHSKFVTE